MRFFETFLPPIFAVFVQKSAQQGHLSFNTTRFEDPRPLIFLL